MIELGGKDYGYFYVEEVRENLSSVKRMKGWYSQRRIEGDGSLICAN